MTSTRLIRNLCYFLLLIGVGLSGCAAPADLPAVERVYATTPAGAADADGPYQAEIEALEARLLNQGDSVALRPANAEGLAWLSGMGVPESVQSFYAAAEPAELIEIEGVYLEPIADLMDANANAFPGPVASGFGYVAVAETVNGDLYAVNIHELDDEGQPRVYIVDHNHVGEGASLQQLREHARPVAESFAGFLARLAAGHLPYDYSGSAEITDGETLPPPFIAYVDAAGRFEAEYPNTWIVVQEEGSPDEVYFVNPGSMDQRVATGIIVQGASRDLGNVAEAADAYLRQQQGVSEFRLVEEVGVEVNGLRGIERLVTYTLAGEETRQFSQRTVYLQHPEHTFVLNMTVLSETLEQNSLIFNQLLRTFQVTR
jgi:hypothetical protein